MIKTTTALGFQKLAGFFYSGLGATYTTTVTPVTGVIKSFNVVKRPISSVTSSVLGTGGNSGTVISTENADVEFELEVWGHVTTIGTFTINSTATGTQQGSNIASYAENSSGSITGLVDPKTGGTIFINALNSLKVDPTLNDVPVDTSNITSVVAGPTSDANTASEYTTLQSTFPKVYSFNQAAGVTTTANKYLIVPGGFIANTYGEGAIPNAKGWPQIANWYSNGMFETVIDAKEFAIVGYTNQASDFTMSLLIDGKSPTAEQITVVATSGNDPRWITVTLKTRKSSIVTFSNFGNVIKEIRVKNTDTISKPPLRQRMAIYGDSFAGRTFNSGSPDLVTAGALVVGDKYTILTVGTTDFTLVGAASNTVGVVFTATGVGAGTGTTASIQFRSQDQLITVGARVSRMLGLPQPHQSCTGGTGFGTGATDDTYLLRMNLEVGDPSVAICWIFGTGNDNENSTLLRGLMNQTFDKAKLLYPNAQLILTSCYDAFPTAGSALALNTIYSEVVASRNDVILIPIGTYHTGDDGMLVGTGSIQSPSGSGNADIYLGFSGGGADRHWNAKGIKYGAEYIARKIASILSLYFN